MRQTEETWEAGRGPFTRWWSKVCRALLPLEAQGRVARAAANVRFERAVAGQPCAGWIIWLGLTQEPSERWDS